MKILKENRSVYSTIFRSFVNHSNLFPLQKTQAKHMFFKGKLIDYRCESQKTFELSLLAVSSGFISASIFFSPETPHGLGCVSPSFDPVARDEGKRNSPNKQAGSKKKHQENK